MMSEQSQTEGLSVFSRWSLIKGFEASIFFTSCWYKWFSISNKIIYFSAIETQKWKPRVETVRQPTIVTKGGRRIHWEGEMSAEQREPFRKHASFKVRKSLVVYTRDILMLSKRMKSFAKLDWSIRSKSSNNSASCHRNKFVGCGLLGI